MKLYKVEITSEGKRKLDGEYTVELGEPEVWINTRAYSELADLLLGKLQENEIDD